MGHGWPRIYTDFFWVMVLRLGGGREKASRVGGLGVEVCFFVGEREIVGGGVSGGCCGRWGRFGLGCGSGSCRG